MKKKLSLIIIVLIFALLMSSCSEIAGAVAESVLETIEESDSVESQEIISSQEDISENITEDSSMEDNAGLSDDFTDSLEIIENADSNAADYEEDADDNQNTASAIKFDGEYDDKESVALYIHTYGCLPGNYITKKDAKSLGWSGGSLEPYAPGKCIGGDYFGNYEGNLPEATGRTYHECDIGTQYANSRGAKRIVYSSDGLIYYTEDHYETFELLYGEES